MAERLRLSSRHRKTTEALLRRHLPGVEAWVYGSRIHGRSHGGSDLDPALRAPGLRQIDVDRLKGLSEAFRESNIPFLVEARDWTQLPEKFPQGNRKRPCCARTRAACGKTEILKTSFENFAMPFAKMVCRKL